MTVSGSLEIINCDDFGRYLNPTLIYMYCSKITNATLSDVSTLVTQIYKVATKKKSKTG